MEIAPSDPGHVLRRPSAIPVTEEDASMGGGSVLAAAHCAIKSASERAATSPQAGVKRSCWA
eukprot:15440461-Alexandrium_andersonii.AAC.1